MPSLAILVSVILVLSCGQTDKQTKSHTDADDRLTHAARVITTYLHHLMQKRATKLIISLKTLPYKERLRKLKLPTLKYRRLKAKKLKS